MPYPSLAELAAELPLPDGMPPFLLAVADDDGRLRDRFASGENAQPSVMHLEELREAVHGGPEGQLFFVCSGGCCTALRLRIPPRERAPLPAAGTIPRYPMVRGFLAAACPPEDARADIRIVMQTLLSAVARLGRRWTVERDLTGRVHFAETIVRSMSSGFLVLAPDLRVTHANPAAAALLQTTEECLVGAELTDFVISDLKVRRVFSSGRPLVDEEVFIKLASGRTVHILKTAVPVFGDSGEVIAVLDHFREIREARQLVSRMSGTRASFTFDDIIYSSPAMGEAVELARMAAGSTLSVLIHGESGTGKELFAHAIHQAGSRHSAPFVVIDCASMPRELVESELFGYAEGAFTGARRGGRPGKFELANGGTVFLDELAELPLELQSRLLRVLQNREVVRLGGAEPLPVDIRVIAATNRDLNEEVRLGNFRADLFHRLNVLAIHIPPLRSRPQDILTLSAYFLRKYRERFKRPDLVLNTEVLAALESRPWPGNARELENTIARAVQLCRRAIEVDHVRQNGSPPRRDAPVPALPAQGASLEEIERRAFRDAVAAANGNITRAARMLGVARSTIYKKLRAP